MIDELSLGSPSEVIQEPVKSKESKLNYVRWTEKETETLLKVFRRTGQYGPVARTLQYRTYNAIRSKVGRLRRNGIELPLYKSISG
jgi:hypothetical protein